MKELKLWWYRTFVVLRTQKATELNLAYKRGVYGDEINHLGCRSIWVDSKGRTYRVHEL